MHKKSTVASDVFSDVCDFFEGAPTAELGALVGILRAAAMLHQSHHWQISGVSFYGDHLLFERIYGDSQGFIDQVAEKAVSLGGINLVCPKTQAAIVGYLVELWCTESLDVSAAKMVQTSLEVENCVIACLREAKKNLEARDGLTEGTDNLIQGIIDKHEEFVYLLQQRQSIKVASYSYRRASEDPGYRKYKIIEKNYLEVMKERAEIVRQNASNRMRGKPSLPVPDLPEIPIAYHIIINGTYEGAAYDYKYALQAASEINSRDYNDSGHIEIEVYNGATRKLIRKVKVNE